MDPISAYIFATIAAIGTLCSIPVTLKELRRRRALEAQPTYPSIVSPPKPNRERVIPIHDEESDVPKLYGREQEIEDLKQWILENNCRLVRISGMGGIGKSTLVSEVVKQIRPRFDAYVGLSLKNAPRIEDTLEHLLNSLPKKRNALPLGTIGQQISSLMDTLKKRRCLLVLDNAEGILSNGRIGQYREGYEGYEELISKIGSLIHTSCLILIGQELPEELGLTITDFYHLPLQGLQPNAGWKLFEEYYLSKGQEPCSVEPEAEGDQEAIVQHYAGNPLMLKLASALVQDAYQGRVSEFVARHLDQGMTEVEAIQELLDFHFNRLSPSEWDVMYWLAIEREPITLEDLQRNAISPEDQGRMATAIISLVKRRSLVESSRNSSSQTFVLPDVLMNHTTQRFIEKVCEDLQQEHSSLLHSHAILKAQAKDYIREAQLHFILKPILDKLQTQSSQDLESTLRQLISNQQNRAGRALRPTYLVGNILNLFVQLEIDLKGQDFSGLSIRQAFLRDVPLQGIDFTNSDLSQSVFSEAYDCIHSVAFSPDGGLIATSESSGNIRLWRSLSNEQPLTFEKKHDDQVWSIAFNPNGNQLASAGQDRTVCLWDVESGQHIRTFQHRDAGIVRSVAFHPNKKTLASGGEECCVRLWDVESGECCGCSATDSPVYFVTFSPDGSLLATGLQNGKIFVWDAIKGEHIYALDKHTDVVYSVSFSPDGTKLASGSADGSICIWDVKTGELAQISEGYKTRIRSIAFSPDGEKLVLGGDDRAIRLWNIQTRQTQIMQSNGHTSRVRSVAFSPDGQTIVSGSDDHSIKFWDTNDTRCRKTLAGGSTNRFWSISLRHDGKHLVSGSEDGSVRLWDLEDSENIKVAKELRGHDAWVWSVAFSPDGRILASSSEDGTIRLWRVETGENLKTVQKHVGRIRSLAFSTNGRILASAGADKAILLWDVNSGNSFKKLQGHADRVLSVAFNPQNNILASGGQDKKILLWDITTGEYFRILDEHGAQVHSVSFSPDGSILASGSFDRKIKLWDVKTWECLRTLEDHTDQILSVSFSANGRTLASCGHDREIKIWDVEEGKCLRTLTGHDRAVESVTFASDSQVLISASQDETIRFWHTDTGECLETVRVKRLYEQMKITGVKGLTETQKTILKALGAIEMG